MDSQQQFRAGESRGQGQAMTEDWLQSAKDTTNAARDKVSDVTHHTSNSAQQHKDESAGFLHQKGEQMMNMAQGAVDSVKSTLGVGDNSNIKK
ncbi:late embryogenesis abundant protein 1-like [Macadamia integrifolia]|uniref:late embryogenesis abundant protein 1-like n=1 Tax=Macadamia integrifolia TaxID=60698 RepID=UPI001C4F0C21|nr:late embryogenesis abundant protein 1-like [Macadamia integrifolia]